MEQVLRVRWVVPEEAEQTAPRPRVAADWPLMGDILTHRAGWPEHLIRWRRAEGEDEPGARLKPPRGTVRRQRARGGVAGLQAKD